MCNGSVVREGVLDSQITLVGVLLISGVSSDGPVRFDRRKLIVMGTQRPQDYVYFNSIKYIADGKLKRQYNF